MKKWCKFFGLSFFSHKAAKEGAKRGYANVFLGFILALILLWAGFILGEMLPFSVHYGNSPDFIATVHSVFANTDADKRICAEVEKGDLKLKKQGGEYVVGLLVNTFESDSDKQDYSINGYNVVVDARPANTLAEVEAFCLSNDGKNTEITYEEYLTLSEVARLNFDFKLRYTGKALLLTDEKVAGYREYLVGLNEENKAAAEKLSGELAENKITKTEYNRGIYELYFVSYYPEITEYESISKVPLLRNYYYHQYIKNGINKYLFIFDDYVTGSFETKGGIVIPFYGFYSNLENGAVITEGATQNEANSSADSFIKKTFNANWFLNAYAYLMNIITLVPFVALMIMVATLLSYSVLKLCSIESVASLGAMFKITGSFVWFSGVIAAVLAVIFSFFIKRSLLTALPLVLFFAALVVRSIIFVINERKLYTIQSEQQKAEQTEV